jgi:hypothetical protein
MRADLSGGGEQVGAVRGLRDHLDVRLVVEHFP